MMIKTKPGVVSVKICGVRLLIPTREASESGSKPLQLNLITGGVWDCYDKGRSVSEVKKALGILIKKPEQEIDAIWDRIVNGLIENGCLITEEEEK